MSRATKLEELPEDFGGAPIRDALRQSNYIEREDGNIDSPLFAWEHLISFIDLSHTAILSTHKILMNDKPYPPPRGHYRNVAGINVRVGSWSAPAAGRVPDLMDHWLTDYMEKTPKHAHIDFERIHPFADGNGRIGRMIMYWMQLRKGLPLGSIHENDAPEYYQWFRT